MSEMLAVKKLTKYFLIKQPGLFRKKAVYLRAVDNIDFTVEEGETLGLVGESGSGKSTTAYMIVGMYSPTSGEILFKGTDITMLVTKRPLNVKKEIAIVFQDPSTSLNPQHTIRQILTLPLAVHKIVPKSQLNDKIEELLKTVELPAIYAFKQPRAIGGGEKQLVAIARAIATNPSLIVLDEPTSALDVSVQARIINKLLDLQKKLNLSYLFITHDLSLMRNVANRVAIMYLGKIREIASTKEFFENPLHPYTQMLLSAIPVVSEKEDAVKQKKSLSKGEIPSPVNLPPGCGFNPRCQYKMDICLREDPIIREVSPGHYVRCHYINRGERWI